MTINQVSKICYVGAGYVGGTSAAVMALANPGIQVIVVDTSRAKTDRWNSKHVPINEAGLDLVIRITRDGLSEHDSAQPQRAANLVFSTDCSRHVREADIIFLTVSTSTKDYGEGAGAAIDIGDLKIAVETIAVAAKPGAIIVEKSTVPCKTAQMIQDILQYHRPGVPFEVLSNPEFLAEGTAVMDLLRPSRVLIGSGKTASGLAAAEKLASLYHWISPEKILRANHWSAELAKLASNAILAQRLSSINTIGAMCEAIGADITEVSRAVGMDPRIGPSYLQSGLGFGGSCLRKDTLGLAYLAEVDRFVERVIQSFHGTLRGKKLVVFGYAFKENISDSRESQSIQVIRQLLLEQPEEITVYDPGCDLDFMQDELLRTLSPMNSPVKTYQNPYEACEGASAVLILTPWEAFKARSSPWCQPVNWGSLLKHMKQPRWVFDTRRQVQAEELEKLGCKVVTLGRSSFGA
ncbi:nucleotide sugar dehydrogenase [Cucurbitaria berberidis CBS 394.84]|uniref:UDP-glucose 6-dehydrogenase n=1 Tax=Cucurbitaria berberidis CBS 394.84 TaxID=1168544 RepID=A0A9P4L561_9PLEO|nr:nucleotide sugar dehydrogenase [Cucurbitaria berberidis CBS 394.84]KAF1842616.1 nucleotide sugar dehydrogenase [Cucurbitaria berberidis CBS 394.84]